MQFNKPKTYKSYGSQAILIEWQAKIDEAILESIILFKTKIEDQLKGQIQDVIVGYNSLTVIFKDDILDFIAIRKQLQELYQEDISNEKQENIVWEIPVCYDVSFGIDLEEMSSISGLSINEIIEIHSQTLYTVYFIGFLPGFLYLGGLDERLFFERKPNPRLQVAKGTVAIGGKQTGIYPEQSAGGWNCIGKTPISFFNVNIAEPCFAKSGDKIKFKPISKDEFESINQEIEEGNYKLTKTSLHA